MSSYDERCGQAWETQSDAARPPMVAEPFCRRAASLFLKIGGTDWNDLPHAMQHPSMRPHEARQPVNQPPTQPASTRPTTCFSQKTVYLHPHTTVMHGASQPHRLTMKSKLTLVLIALFATAFAYAGEGKKEGKDCSKDKDSCCCCCKDHDKKCDQEKAHKKDCKKDDCKKDEAKKDDAKKE